MTARTRGLELRSTTILSVRHKGRVVMAGDGQVSFENSAPCCAESTLTERLTKSPNESALFLIRSILKGRHGSLKSLFTPHAPVRLLYCCGGVAQRVRRPSRVLAWRCICFAERGKRPPFHAIIVST